MKTKHVSFSEMTWPLPCGETNWLLRYGQPTRQDMLHAASVMEAYAELLSCPERKRRMVVRGIRAKAGRKDF